MIRCKECNLKKPKFYTWKFLKRPKASFFDTYKFYVYKETINLNKFLNSAFLYWLFSLKKKNKKYDINYTIKIINICYTKTQ